MMRRPSFDLVHLFILLVLGLGLALTGCARSYVGEAQGRDAGTRAGVDGGRPPNMPDGGARAPCAPMDAEGRGLCLLAFGVAWNGADCVFVGGCTCAGDDCGALFEDFDACRAATSDCAPAARCGGFGGDVCGDDEWCDFPDGLCGAADGTGVCRARPAGCPDVWDPVCACDGEIHSNACDARMAGFDVSELGCD